VEGTGVQLRPFVTYQDFRETHAS